MTLDLPTVRRSRLINLSALLAAALLAPAGAWAQPRADDRPDPGHEHAYFERIATFPVFLNTDVDAQTVAEIVDASEDGKTLVYTDALTGNVGFVDITDPAKPRPGGTVTVGGEPTSVAVAGRYALVAVDTSASFAQPSGRLDVIDIAGREIVRSLELGGQPDSVAVSPDRRYAAIAIENERDEDLGDGRPPQAPPGFLRIVDLTGQPGAWRLRRVDLTGIPELFPEDPEPEYVDINRFNIAAVTLQENNHVVLVDLPTGRLLRDWSAGVVDLSQIDVLENALIELTGTLSDVPREPDGVAWVTPFTLATADEGDLDGGSRGFTLFDTRGRVRFSSGNALEHAVVRLGHYPEDRSENKGNEPENVEYARFGDDRLLFVASERASVVFVYRLGDSGEAPELLQVLPAAVGPEGVHAIPERGLLVAASEEDAREDGIRSAITLYQRKGNRPAYPTVASADRRDGTPIPWAALSGLAVDARRPDRAYTVHDSFYRESRIFVMDIEGHPAVIRREIVLKDTLGRLAAVAPDLVNPDATVNLDLEGIALRAAGGFWLVSEGAGSVDDPARPVTSRNLLLRVSEGGAIQQVVTLPASTDARQRRFGYEGVAAVGSPRNEQVFVAFQREWVGDPARRVRIGRYDVQRGEWRFFYYPIEAVASPNGGFVGLSDLTPLGGNAFAVVERDDQAGTDAVIKRIYRFSVAGVSPRPDAPAGTTPSFPVLKKTLVRDLLPDLKAPGGAVLEKIEGLAALPGGDALIVNDNDGVDGSNGETQLLHLKRVFR